MLAESISPEQHTLPQTKDSHTVPEVEEPNNKGEKASKPAVEEEAPLCSSLFHKYNPVIGKSINPTPPEFDEELKSKRFKYLYRNGWTYEIYVPNDSRVIYNISGGPMNGRKNFQTAYYQRVCKNIWQINFLEETGTIVSICVNMENKTLTTLIAFSQGHWENPDIAHGYKTQDLAKWRELSKIGIHTNRYLITEQADILEICEGPGDLPEIDMEWSTF